MSSRRTERSITAYRPRDHRNPVDRLDFLDRHLAAATGSDEVLRRYVKLLLVVGTAAVVLVGLGVAGAVRIAALSPWAAGGVGSGAATATVVVCVVLARRMRGKCARRASRR